MRNRVKRIIREIFRKELKNIGSYDLMIIARKSSGDVDYREIRDDILMLIRSIREN